MLPPASPRDRQFAKLIGPQDRGTYLAALGGNRAELKLDQKGEVARALASRNTWSGIVVPWPVDGTSDRLPVEMSGLPVFDRDRQFAAIAASASAATSTGSAAAHRAAGGRSDHGANATRNRANVLPFPRGQAAPRPALNPVEQSAFQELGRELERPAEQDRRHRTCRRRWTTISAPNSLPHPPAAEP